MTGSPFDRKARSHAAQQRPALTGFLNYYNHERPHSALGQQAPASRVPIAAYRLTASGIKTPAGPPVPVQLSFDDLAV